MTLSCRCKAQVLADDVERIRTFYTDGSSEEHGREYCATGGPSFWRSNNGGPPEPLDCYTIADGRPRCMELNGEGVQCKWSATHTGGTPHSFDSYWKR